MGVKIEGLPEDNCNYVLLWPGSVVLSPTQEQYLIELQIAKVSDSSLKHGGPYNLLYASEKDIETTAQIPVKYIPLLRIGGVFKNGVRIKKNIFSEFNIKFKKPFDFETFKLNDRLNFDENLKKDYKLYLKSTFSNSLYCSAPKGQFEILGQNSIDEVLIPCYEILRFYYLRSDNLVDAVFDGASDKEWHKIYNEEKTNLIDDTQNWSSIVINKKMLFNDGPVIHRMTRNEVARSNLKSFYYKFRHGISSDRKKGVINCKIPYNKSIDLKVSGLIIRNEVSPGKFKTDFVVTQINSHKDQWDFEQLDIRKDVNITDSDNGGLTGIDVTKIIKVATPNGGTFLIEPYVTNLPGTKNIIESNEEKDDNYNNINIKKGYLDDSEYIEGSIVDLYTTSQGPYVGLEIGEPDIELPPKERIKIKRDSEEALDKVLINFIEALECCKTNAGRDKIVLKYCVVEKDENNPKTTNFPPHLFNWNKDSDSYKWLHCVFNATTRKWEKKRRAVLVEITFNNNTCYFLKFRPSYRITEISTKFLKTTNNTPLDIDDQKKLLADFAKGCGKLRPIDKPNATSIGGKIPDSTAVELYAKKLLEKIKSVVSFIVIEPEKK